MPFPEDINAAAIAALGAREMRRVCDCQNGQRTVTPQFLPSTADLMAGGNWITVVSCSLCGASTIYRTKTLIGEALFNEIKARHPGQ